MRATCASHALTGVAALLWRASSRGLTSQSLPDRNPSDAGWIPFASNPHPETRGYPVPQAARGCQLATNATPAIPVQP